LTLAVVMVVAFIYPTATQAVEVDPPAAGDSVLVVVPSPGADVAMAAGITSALTSYADGAGVTIAYLTNGDYDGDAARGLTRQGEAVTAQVDHLGRAETDLIFFGYPDGYLKPVWETAAPATWVNVGVPAAPTQTYASSGLGSTDWHFYWTGLEGTAVHADYNADAMLEDMVKLITERRPDHIFTASEHNANDDYATTNAVVTAAVEAVVAADPTYGTVVHGAVVWHPDTDLHSTWPQGANPAADILQDTVVDPTASPSLEDVGLLWAEREQFVVPAAMQDTDTEPSTTSNPKVLAVDEHQAIGGMGDLLSRFVHRDEVFWAETYAVISVADATVTEGGTAEFTISRTGPTDYPVSVTAATSDGTAVAPGDYTAQAATVVTIPAGAASVTFDVPTVDNDIDDGDRTFTVTLTAPLSPSVLGDATATGTITDDDTAGVTIDVGDGLTVVEGGPSDTYEVVLDSEPTDDVVITVTPDAQVTAAPSPLTFTAADWDTPQSVIVTGIADGVDEPAHTGTISHTAASATDAKYDGISVADVTVTVADTGALVIAVSGPTTWSTGLAAEYSATVTIGGSGTVTFAWAVTRGTTTVATGSGADFSFTPTLGGAHTVTVTPSDDDGAGTPVAVTTNVLTDIEDSIFVQDIIWLADEGITRGCNPPVNDEFCPTDNVTRGQMAAFLVRFLGLTDNGGGDLFTDDDDSIFENDIDKLATAGITRGCNPPTNDNFCPDDNVTRGQMAAFLVRALGLTDNGGGDLFTDDDGSIFENDIDKLATAGITRGCNPPTNDNFCPDDNVTRGQMAAFIRRAAALP
jgi:hypothetical protein